MTEVLHWRFGDVAARLLDGRAQPDPPADWPCWSVPTPALPIDDMVARLIGRNADPRLRSPAELQKRDIQCPFYAARFALAAAVDAATSTAEEDPAEMANRWQAQEQAALQACAANAPLADTLLQSERRPVPRLPFLESVDLIEAHKTVLRYKRACARIIDDAQRWQRFYRQIRGEPFDTWRSVFVAELSFIWTILTGAPPARGEGFTGFVEAAYASVTDDEIPWDRAIRRVVELDLDWHGRSMTFTEVQKLFFGWSEKND